MLRPMLIYPSGFKNSSYLNFSSIKLRTNLIFRKEDAEYSRIFYFEKNTFKLCVLVNSTSHVYSIQQNELNEIEHKICTEDETLEIWKIDNGYV